MLFILQLKSFGINQVYNWINIFILTFFKNHVSTSCMFFKSVLTALSSLYSDSFELIIIFVCANAFSFKSHSQLACCNELLTNWVIKIESQTSLVVSITYVYLWSHSRSWFVIRIIEKWLGVHIDNSGLLVYGGFTRKQTLIS